MSGLGFWVARRSFAELGLGFWQLTGANANFSELGLGWGHFKAVFQGGWFPILIFSHVQPMEYMVIMSDKLEFTVIDSMLN